MGHLELLMLVAMRTVGPAGLRDVDHFVSMFNGKKKEPIIYCQVIWYPIKVVVHCIRVW